MKLTKVQREILTNAVESFKTYGVAKPIHCPIHWRSNIDSFAKNYSSYCKQMYKLLDAGIIAMGENETTYAYIVDIKQVENLLKSA